jgi:hypothetical protein
MDREISATTLMRRAIIDIDRKYGGYDSLSAAWEKFLVEQQLLDLMVAGRMPRKTKTF